MKIELADVLLIKEPLEFLDTLIRFGELYRSASADDFDNLAEARKMVISIRAFFLSLKAGYFGEFIRDTSAGHRIHLLKEYCAKIGAGQAVNFIRSVEAEFPDGKIPVDEMLRIEAIDNVEERLGPMWLIEKNDDYNRTGEDIVALLKNYIKQNLTLFEFQLGSTA